MGTAVTGKLQEELAFYQTLINPSNTHIKPDLGISTPTMIYLGIEL